VPPDFAESLKLNSQDLTLGCCKKMPMAFVLINAEIGSEDQVVKELKSVPQVKEAYMVYGVYDIVAKVAADSMDKLKEIITWKVRHLNKVKSTLTMIVIEN
jgi:DNA-binding Lrp family transcriptional regulator